MKYINWSTIKLVFCGGAFVVTNAVSARTEYVQFFDLKDDNQEAQNKDKNEKIIKVEVKAMSESANARSDASAKTVITASELARYGATNIENALRNVPGVLVIQGKIQLPGMGSSYTQILVDGEPPRGVNINDIPLSTIERVEIFRQGNAQFSSQGIAGTINIVLKRVSNVSQSQFKVNLTNEYKTTGSIEWLNSDKHDNLSYSISALARDSGATFSAPYKIESDVFDSKNKLIQKYIQTNNRVIEDRSLRLNPRIQIKTKDGINLTLTSSIGGSNKNTTRDQEYLFLVGDEYPIAKSISHTDEDSVSGNLNLRTIFNLNSDWKVDMNLGVNGKKTTTHVLENTYNTSQVAVFERDTNLNLSNFGLNHSLKLTLPSGKNHDIVTGWNGASTTTNTRREDYQVEDNIQKSTKITQKTNTDIGKFALFAQDEWKYTREVSIYLGARWEYVRMKTEGTNQDPILNESSVISPIVQTLWKLNPENTDRVRLGISRTYQPPPDYYLITPKWEIVNNSIQNPNLIGNPALRPELAWSLDVAYEHNGTDDLSFNLRSKFRSIKDMHRENLSFSQNNWWMQYINAGDGTSLTLEFDTQFPLKRFFPKAPEVDFNFSISKNWTRVSGIPKPDNLLSPITLSINLGLDYSPKNVPLNMGINTVFNDSRWQQINLIKREYSTNPPQLDLFTLWKIDKQSQLRITVGNILKRKYAFLTQRNYEGFTSNNNYLNPVFRRVSINYESKF